MDTTLSFLTLSLLSRVTELAYLLKMRRLLWGKCYCTPHSTSSVYLEKFASIDTRKSIISSKHLYTTVDSIYERNALSD
jgi:hypothetical protein